MKIPFALFFVTAALAGGKFVGFVAHEPKWGSSGCLYSEPASPEKAYLASDPGTSAHASIDGKTSTLKLVDSNLMTARNKGDRVSFKYQAGPLNVSYTGRRLAECALDGPLCESSHGTLTFERGSKKVSHDVVEWCGKLTPAS